MEKELKDIKKQNKMLYIISKKYGSRCETKKINNTREKASKSTSVSSSDDLESDLSLAIDGI